MSGSSNKSSTYIESDNSLDEDNDGNNNDVPPLNVAIGNLGGFEQGGDA